MKSQLKKLNRISKIECLSLDNYYCIELTKSSINLQAHFSGQLAMQLLPIFGAGVVDKFNGYIGFVKYNISITLT